LSDVNIQNDNSHNNFLVITKTTELGDVETNQRNVSSSLHSEQKARHAVDQFAKQLNLCAKAWGDTTNVHNECKI